MTSVPTIRELDPATDDLDWVATHMRATLVQVLGAERGEVMYTLDWLRDRVRFHLKPGRAAFLAELDGRRVGHCLVRVEAEGVGLFATTFVLKETRRRGVAGALLDRGELWMREQGLMHGRTATAVDNDKLIALFAKRGYAVIERHGEMVLMAGSL